MNWLVYLVQVNAYLLVFYGFYRLVLRQETFHQLNRSFLLAGAALSFFVPLVQLAWLQGWFLTDRLSSTINQYYDPGLIYTRPGAFAGEVNPRPIMWGHVLLLGYLCGVLFFLGKFAFQLVQLGQLLRHRPYHRPDERQAYSFFGHFFVGRALAHRSTIEAHERVHVRQLHSADVLFCELITVFCWFNPAVHGLCRDIRLLHEFIADETASRLEASRADYALLLLSQEFAIDPEGLNHSFFRFSTLKSRILMLKRTPSRRRALLKYALAAPMLGGMLVLASAFGRAGGALAQQAPPKAAAAADSVMAMPEKQAEFPGGMPELSRYLASAMQYPRQAWLRNEAGKVFVRFNVEKDGSLSDVQVMRSVSSLLDEEALRVVRAMPRWQPATNAGQPVRSQFVMPIAFVLPPPR